MSSTRAHFNCRCASERILTTIAPTAGINRTAELLLHRAFGTRSCIAFVMLAKNSPRLCALQFVGRLKLTVITLRRNSE